MNCMCSQISVMRLVGSVSAIFLILLAVNAKSAEPDPLIGVWQLVEQPYNLTMQFNEDGSFLAKTAAQAVYGQWEKVDDTHIATWSSAKKPKRISVFRLEASYLIIIDQFQGALIHQRLE